jgi:15-cis-phytoene synthase
MPREAEDLAACRALLRAGSKSFSLAARLLPRPVREATTVLYAFLRIADDLIDADPGASAATVRQLRERLRRLYQGRPDDFPVDRALARVVAGHPVRVELFEAFLQGLEWDVAGRRYQTIEELHAYGARVAGTVGMMMAAVMGRREVMSLSRACALGIAMQLTNIARDVGEDARRGRLYLPLDWLVEAGLDPEAFLRQPAPSPALAQVVSRLLDEADRMYQLADPGIEGLPADCRLAIRAARLIYAEIGRYVAAAGFDSVTRRASVPRWRKLWLLGSATRAQFFPRGAVFSRKRPGARAAAGG